MEITHVHDGYRFTITPTHRGLDIAIAVDDEETTALVAFEVEQDAQTSRVCVRAWDQVYYPLECDANIVYTVVERDDL